MEQEPGLLVLFGSGETSPSGQQVFDWLFSRLAGLGRSPVRVAILETPAGFELNSAQVAGRIGEFLEHHLQNYCPQVTVVPARRRGTPFSPDDPAIARQIPGADAIFLGPGSPTYAARQLEDSLAWQTVVACHRLGAALVLASAAAVAAGTHTLPVYEIYKAGHDLHWRPGLDLLAPFGLRLVFVPHWNNREGGEALDTGRCYMGQDRFQALLALLPDDVTVAGIDEHTALVLDLAASIGMVLGAGGVSLLARGAERRLERRQVLSLRELGPLRRPAPGESLPAGLWSGVQAALAQAADNRSRAAAPAPAAPCEVPPEVQALLGQRDAARAAADWPAADALRRRLNDLGWQVDDTPEGSRLLRK